MGIVERIDVEFARVRSGGNQAKFKITEEEYKELSDYVTFPIFSPEQALIHQKEVGYALNYNGLELIL